MRSKRTATGGQEIPSDHADLPTLPAWKAFVVQFSRETRTQGETFAGRIEHISSGRCDRFASPEELLAALGKLLDQLGETPA